MNKPVKPLPLIIGLPLIVILGIGLNILLPEPDEAFYRMGHHEVVEVTSNPQKEECLVMFQEKNTNETVFFIVEPSDYRTCNYLVKGETAYLKHGRILTNWVSGMPVIP